MIDVNQLADPATCPNCRSALRPPRPPGCPACGVPLAGPVAGELFRVETDAKRLLVRREQLLTALRQIPAEAARAAQRVAAQPVSVGAEATAQRPAAPAAAPRSRVPARPAQAPVFSAPGAPPMFGPPSAWHDDATAAAAPSAEVGRRRIARLVLGIGVLLVIVAAAVFVAVTWERTGTGGRAVVMGLLLVLSAAGAAVAEKRELPSTAEALGVVSVAMGLLDGYAAWAADLGGLRGAPATVVSAVTLAAVGGAAWAGSRVLGLRSLRISAALLLQGPVPLVAAWVGVSRGSLLPLGLGFVLQALAEVALLVPVFRGKSPSGAPAARVTLVGAAAYWVAGYVLVAVSAGGVGAAVSMPLVAVAAAVAARLLRPSVVLRNLASGAAAVALLTVFPVAAALLPSRDGDADLSTAWAFTVIGMVGLVLVAAVFAVPRPYRRGPLAVAAVPALVGVGTAVVVVVTAIAGPVAWAWHAWTGAGAGSAARWLLAPSQHWSLGAAPLAAVPVAGATAVLAARLTGRARWWRAVAAVSVWGTAAVLPLSADLPFGWALGWHVLLGIALVVAGWQARLRSAPNAAVSARPLGVAAQALGAAHLCLAAAWSLADSPTALATWLVGAVALAATTPLLPAVTRPGAAGAATAMLFADAAFGARQLGVPAASAGAGFAVAGALAAVAGIFAVRRLGAVPEPNAGVIRITEAVTAVSGLALFVGLDVAATRPETAAVALAATACCTAFAAWAATARRWLWSAAATAASVATVWTSAYALLGHDSARAALAAAVTAAAALVAAPSPGTARVSLVKASPDADHTPVRTAWAVELTAAAAYLAALLVTSTAGVTRGIALAAALAAALVSLPAGRSVLRPVWPPVAAALVLACAAVWPDARGLAPSGIGMVMVATAAAGFAVLPHVPRRWFPQMPPPAAVLVAGAAAGLAAVRAEQLWIALAGCAAASAAVGFVPCRRTDAALWRVGARLAAGGLTLAAYWDGLAVAGVTMPEAYTLPPALVALVAGWRIRSAKPALPSWPAYCPGLALLLFPSLPLAVSDDGAVRPALVGAAALTALLCGARFRLQAPLLLGAAALAVIGVAQLSAPVLAAYHALPRWGVLAGAGLLLIAVGASYERSLRDLTRLGRAVRALD